MTPERRTEIVRRIALTAAKARSNAAEAGTLDVAEMLDPATYGTGPLSLITVTERMLDDGRVPEPIDLVNLVYLAGRAPGFEAMHFARWQEDLPAVENLLTAGLG